MELLEGNLVAIDVNIFKEKNFSHSAIHTFLKLSEYVKSSFRNIYVFIIFVN